MKKSDLKYGTILIQKKASKHTDKLHKIEIKGVYMQYSYAKNRCYTYYTVMTCEGQCYPAANSSYERPLILDGLIGTYDLSKLKREYKILEQ